MGESTPQSGSDGDEAQGPHGRESLGVSIIEQPPPSAILVSDGSIADESQPAKKRREQDTEKLEKSFFNKKEKTNADAGASNRSTKGVPLCQIIQESGASSLQDAGGCCAWDAAARAAFYHAKLMATLQVLANKEETVRVQGESLRVAEARIATLTARAATLRAELDDKAQELQTLRRALEKSRAEKTDVSVTADVQEVENQKNIVRSLEINLSVIEDLYRECFYETAKQEELIEMLRKSYLDARLMDRSQADQIGRLQSVVHTQQWSLERCQDIAMEVEGLKMEISNFLSSSNNDSGMWERSEGSRLEEEVCEELQGIAAQLLQLKTVLSGDCTCGLEEENMTLKNLNENLQIQVGSLTERVSELEASLANKENEEQCNCRDEIAEKEQELNSVRRRLAELEESACDRAGACESLADQLRQAQASMEQQTRELAEARARCHGHEAAIAQLNDELEKANHIIEEGRSLREEVSAMRRAVCASGRRTHALAAELTRAHKQCQSLDQSYTSKAAAAAALGGALEAAQARGAALCADVRRVVAAVTCRMRRMRDLQRQQEHRIKELEALNKALQHGKRNGIIQPSNTNDPCCSKCIERQCTRDCLCATEMATEFDETAQLHRNHSANSFKCTSQMRKRRQTVSNPGESKSVACKCHPQNELKGVTITGCESTPNIREKRRLRLKTTGTDVEICNCPSQGRIYGMKDSNYESAVNVKEDGHLCPKRSGSVVKICECSTAESKVDRSRSSESEIATCSSAPTPPRRLLKKKLSSSDEKMDSWMRGGGWRVRGRAGSEPRRDASIADCDCTVLHAMPREASPCAELEQRMSALLAALEPAQARWTHARGT